MQQIELATLALVTGGASKSAELTTSLNAISTQITDLKSANSGSSGTNNLLLPVMLLALNKRNNGSSVVSTPGATVVTQG